MAINELLNCAAECCDVVPVKHFARPEGDAAAIKMVVVSEAMPKRLDDYFYAPGEPLFIKTTNMAFADAGYRFATYRDYLTNGIYLTTALKCRKKDYLASAATVKNCAAVLAAELSQFPNVKVIMPMGDIAIQAVNHIWRVKYGIRAVPAGSTYKIRAAVHESAGVRFFPSYTQTGDSFGIEKSKRKMIAEDIAAALAVIGASR